MVVQKCDGSTVKKGLRQSDIRELPVYARALLSKQASPYGPTSASTKPAARDRHSYAGCPPQRGPDQVHQNEGDLEPRDHLRLGNVAQVIVDE